MIALTGDSGDPLVDSATAAIQAAAEEQLEIAILAHARAGRTVSAAAAERCRLAVAVIARLVGRAITTDILPDPDLYIAAAAVLAELNHEDHVR